MDLSRIIRAELERENKTPEKFYASDAGRCPLYRLWKREGREGIIQQSGATLIGSWIHEGIRKLVEKHMPFYEWEVPVENEYVKGRVDALCGDELIEIKSTAFISQVKAEPYVHHVLQAQTYAWLLGYVRKIKILYVCKLTLEVVEHELPANPEQARKDWERVIKAWEDGYSEEEVAQPLSWECKLCPYREGCKWKREK